MDCVYVIAFGAAECGEMHLTRRRETEINVMDGLFVCYCFSLKAFPRRLEERL
jgi:hypothetical protein